MTKCALEIRLLLIASTLALKPYAVHAQSHSVPYEEQREQIQMILDQIEEGLLGRLWRMLGDNSEYSDVFQPRSKEEANSIASHEQIAAYLEFSQRPENAHRASWGDWLQYPCAHFLQPESSMTAADLASLEMPTGHLLVVLE